MTPIPSATAATATPFLMIPGPTPLPDDVREALARPAIGHRTPEFKAVLASVLPGLQWAFHTQQPVLLYTASGTGAMEAALINTLNPGDRVLALVCGVFSARWAEVATSLGCEVTRLEVPPGQANLPALLAPALEEDTRQQPAAGRYRAVMLTHSETSTGILNPIEELLPLIQAHGALSIVDAVTSLGATPFYFDGWGVDVAVAGSQKGFMTPPGLSFLALSEKAMAAHQQVRHPGYYFNFTRTLKAQKEYTTPYTPATPLIAALEVALAMMQSEGHDAIWQRHLENRDQTRAGVARLGLSPVVAEAALASHAVTSIYPPQGLAVADIRAALKSRYGILVADGQKELKGKIFRIGHLGYISPDNVARVLAALKEILETS